MPKISALVVAHNEEENLTDCLASLSFADELVVVLDNCTDASKEIAQRFNAKLVEGNWPIEGERRMQGIEVCNGPWIFECDADERVTPELANELKAVIQTSTYQYHIVPINNYIGQTLVKNGWGGSFGCRNKILLFQKGAKIWGNQRVHPSLKLNGTEGPRLKNAANHYVDKNLTETFARLNRYTSAKAADMVETGKLGKKRSHIRRFFSRFWLCYVRRKGYQEGVHGLATALCAGLFPIVSYLKAVEMQEGKNRDHYKPDSA